MPRWERPETVAITCPCCNCIFSIPLDKLGMTERQEEGVLESLREMHPEINEEEPPLGHA